MNIPKAAKIEPGVGCIRDVKVFLLLEKEKITMPTKKSRINITLEGQTAHILTDLAKRNNQPTAGVANELILEALEKREDVALSKLAQSRDIATAARIEHKDAWQ